MNEQHPTQIPADVAETELAHQRATEYDLLAAEERQQARLRAEGATVVPVDSRMTMTEIQTLIGDPKVYQEHIATMRGVAYVIRAYATLDAQERWTGFLAVWHGDGPAPTAKTLYPTRRWDLPVESGIEALVALQEAVLRDMVADVMRSLHDNI